MAAPKKGSKSSGPITKFRAKAKVTRKGIHAKTKMSKNKGSKNYVKVSRGQGWKGETLFGAALLGRLFLWGSPRVGNRKSDGYIEKLNRQMKHLILFESYSSSVKQKETVGAITVSLVPNPQDGDFSIELSSVVKGEAPKSKNKWLLGLFKSLTPSEEIIQTLRVSDNQTGAEEAFKFAVQKSKENQDVSVVFDALVDQRNLGKFAAAGDEEEDDEEFQGFDPGDVEGDDEGDEV